MANSATTASTLIDVLRWGMQKKLPVRVHSTGGRFGYKDQAQTPNTQNVTWVYEDGSTIVGQLRGLYTAEPTSWDFFGTKGHLHINRDGTFRITLGRNKQPEPEVEYPAGHRPFPEFRRCRPSARPQAAARRNRGDEPVDRALPPRQYLVSRQSRAAVRPCQDAVSRRRRSEQAADARVSQTVRRSGEGLIVKRLLLILTAGVCSTGWLVLAQEVGPSFQYRHGDIAIGTPSVEEPTRASFSLAAAVEYLEKGALAWSRERKCVSCHTTGTYGLVRPQLPAKAGTPSQALRQFFLAEVKVLEGKPRSMMKTRPERGAGDLPCGCACALGQTRIGQVIA